MESEKKYSPDDKCFRNKSRHSASTSFLWSMARSGNGWMGMIGRAGDVRLRPFLHITSRIGRTAEDGRDSMDASRWGGETVY